MVTRVRTLCEAAVAILSTPTPATKVALTAATAAAWRSRKIAHVGRALPPDCPARPARPEICPPNRMRRRKAGGGAGKVAFLHALAHIELNAIDLAWDLIARFAAPMQPCAFFDDWVEVAADEAEHFVMLEDLLGDLGSHYGALPAHSGLWDAAAATSGSLRERLAVVPLVLEARALETAPAMIERLAGTGDAKAAAVMARILEDEVAHVATGVRWFHHVCAAEGAEPAAAFRAIVRRHFPKGLKAPFNEAARDRAGFPSDYYKISALSE